jgi:CTP:molybdopterin cytidylyltransferase MocA
MSSGAAATVSGADLRLGGVLLAAGSASRLGHRPKCLLELGGQPLIRRALDALTQAGVGDVVVVLGHHRAWIEPVLQGAAVRTVCNPEPEQGQVSSQRLGLQALGPGHGAVVVALADQPLIDADDVRALLRAWARRPPGTAVVFPRVQGQPGNPVVISDAVRQEILHSDPAVGARQWRQAHPEAVWAWDTDNPHYRVDIDTPQDLARFQDLTGRPLAWPQGLCPGEGSPPAAGA